MDAIDRTVDFNNDTSLRFWGFIHRTVHLIARPILEQKGYYSGHGGYHGIKFQSIVTPDGLIST